MGIVKWNNAIGKWQHCYEATRDLEKALPINSRLDLKHADQNLTKIIEVFSEIIRVICHQSRAISCTHLTKKEVTQKSFKFRALSLRCLQDTINRYSVQCRFS